MLFYNENILKKINEWNDDEFYILADFDRTLTTYNSYNSWGIILNDNNISEDYKKEVCNLFDFYRPIEINENIDRFIREKYMIDWWNEEISLFTKYNLDEKAINNVLKHCKEMTFREGIINFLKIMNEKRIPLIIISAGIGNFIERFLKDNNCYYDNVFIISNFFKFDEGKLIGFNNKIIHSLNKDIINLPNNVSELIKYRNKVILFGDSIGDINMGKNIEKDNIYSVGFLDDNINNNLKYYMNAFDLVATDNTSMNEISNKIKILKR